MTNLHIFHDQAALIQGAADYILQHIQTAIAERGKCSLVLAGGSTPRPVYELLATDAYANEIDWSSVFVFFGDERTVPPDHNDSNYRMAKEALFDHVPIPNEQIFRLRGEVNPHQAAMEYDHALRQFFGLEPPAFDIVLLGMGDDGHTASLFPNTSALAEETHWVLANHVPQQDTWRLTLTAPLINQAQHVAFIISGLKKANRLQEVIHGPHNPHTLPAQLIAATDWLLDQPAASQLEE
jgi:6-phosphogluconolactonase